MQKKSFAVCALILTSGLTSVLAQTVTNYLSLTNSDVLATSSFNVAGNWNSGAAPLTGSPDFNAYFTTNFTLRTPPDANSYTFAGDSLQVDASGALSMKGSGVITVGDLILNGGKVINNGTGGNPDAAVLAGNINVVANSLLDGGGTAGVTSLNVFAPITGSSAITIQDYGTVMLSAANSYLGNTTVNTNSTLKINAANAVPNGPGNGFLTLSGGTPSGAVLDLNGHNTAVNDLSSGGGVFPAQVINSVSGTTNTLTVDCEFATGKTFKGLINDSNVLGGKIALTLVGSTFWTVASNLTCSGDITVNGGRLLMGSSTVLPWGFGKGNIIVNSNGILDLQGRSPQMNGLSGNGTIDNYAGNGPGAGGHSTLNCGSNDVTSTFSGVIQNQYYSTFAPANDYIQLSKFGAGTLTLSGTNTFNGNVSINNGVLRITYQNGDGVTGGGLGLGSETTPPTKTISVNSTLGDSGLHFFATNAPIVVDTSLSFQTAGTNGAIVNEAGNNTINGSISLKTGSGTTIRVDGDTLTLAGNINIVTNTTSRTLTLIGATNGTVSGVIADGSSANVPNTNLLSLTKSGVGTWTLTANNTYSDVTTINGGVLVLGAAASISNTPTISLQNNATFNVAAISGWSLGANQTLSGSGYVIGNVTAQGSVAPGTTNTIGALSFSGSLALTKVTTLKLNRTNSAANADLITATTLSLGGGLTVTNIGSPLQAGDSFNLFHGAITGSFSVTNLPTLSAPLFWDTSLLASQGTLKVGPAGAGVFTNPTGITSFGLNGANVVLTGTNGQAGAAYYLLQSTNVALPLSQWKVAATNVLSANGNYTFIGTNVVTPDNMQQFYLLSNTNSNHN